MWKIIVNVFQTICAVLVLFGWLWSIMVVFGMVRTGG